ncbi:MAG: hypothetical protein AB7N80_10975 [Bdellovibrionales bacterium]
MKGIVICLSLIFSTSAFAYDLKAVKGAAADKAKAHAAEEKNKATEHASKTMEVCKDELTSFSACKGHRTSDTIKTCLAGHKEQLSQGCKSHLGL